MNNTSQSNDYVIAQNNNIEEDMKMEEVCEEEGTITNNNSQQPTNTPPSTTLSSTTPSSSSATSPTNTNSNTLIQPVLVVKKEESEEDSSEEEDEDDLELERELALLQQEKEKVTNVVLKSKNEVRELPPVENITLVIDPLDKIHPIGSISSILSTLVVIQSLPLPSSSSQQPSTTTPIDKANLPPAINEESILCLLDKTILGKVSPSLPLLPSLLLHPLSLLLSYL